MLQQLIPSVKKESATEALKEKPTESGKPTDAQKIPNGAEEVKSKETEKIAGKRDKTEESPSDPKVLLIVNLN